MAVKRERAGVGVGIGAGAGAGIGAGVGAGIGAGVGAARSTGGAAVAGRDVPAPPPELEHTETNCRAREMLVRVGDKWSIYVIHVLGDAGTLRFSELRRRVDGISQRMLTVTLRGLERDGLVERAMYPEVPPRVEYRLTPLGATLREMVRGLIDWSGAHLAEVDAARARYDRQVRGWAEPGG